MPGFQAVTARISGFPGPGTSCAARSAYSIADRLRGGHDNIYVTSKK